MIKTEIKEIVQDIFRDVFDEEELIITEETNAEDIEDWDSLAQVRLTVAIEKQFNIKFNFGELTALHNVGEMLNLIDKKLSV
ncbi:MAG: acyl carrier protein [Butyrivibrio sp.]|nr:acyl carrier protein [Butyrivibrio sp.]